MNRYRISEMVLCLAIIGTGLLYKFASLPLSAVLPVMGILFAIIPFLRYLDGRKRGLTGMGLYLPVLCMALVAVIVIAAWVVYLVQY
ncbi:MAG: hypothetical protein IJ325_08285 [Clostridia bacterium]|nr:hypothetical protein [Clostridia bacterium]